MTMINPADIAKKAKKESEERREAAKFRFPEGEDFPGKVITAEDGLSAKKKTPCYMITLRTKEKRPNGDKADIILYFMKDDDYIGNFYGFLEMAGADLNLLKSKDQDELDEKIGKLLEELEDANPKCTFNCVHKKDSKNNGYYVQEIDKVLAGVGEKSEEKSEKKPEPEPDKSEKKSEKSEPKSEKKSEKESKSNGADNSDSAFDDED